MQPQNKISRQALTVWRMAASFVVGFIFLLFIGYMVFATIFDFPIWIAVILFTVILIYSFFSIIVFPKVRWSKWRYEVFENEIDIQYGKFIVRRVLIPMVRVQHVDTVQGPFLRRYGLATVTISTAATIHQIPALNVQEANKLRDTISRLARVVDEDV